MPFDGAGYIETTQGGFFSRLARIVQAWRPAARTIPSWQLRIPDASPDTLTVQTLKIGRALIEDRKDWVQRRYETRDGRRCAVGALRAAARMINANGAQNGATATLLAVAIGRGFNDIESMNDNSSHKQVLMAFDDAITRATVQPGANAARS
ncbi:MAG: hypothetical protein AB7F35_17135 [Acetobacteraceae bacterium]